ncbi:hypothetical protein Goklo_004699, partial [Gossypium klotzschianum]|nr:hypothetical protein [Gossypium klotzschianum]
MEPTSNRHEPTANSCRLFQLPQPLILGILSRLPIHDLLHCRCVCKRFISLISDPEFAGLHLSISPLCILIKTKPLQKSRKGLHLSHIYAVGASFQVSKLNLHPNLMYPLGIFLISACNGLLCLLGPKKDDPLYVCNPILGEFITIQPPYKEMCRSRFWGLGYSTVTNQYKLLQSYYPIVESNYPMAEIYTIGNRTWRSIGFGNAPTDLVSLPFNAFLNGALHWYNISFGGAGEFINSFDIDTEQFGIVPPPDHFQELDKVFTEYTTTGVLGDCLFICYFPDFVEFDIWVMKEYGVKESWTKQFDAIAYTPCLVSLYNVAKGEQIS